MMTTKSIRIAGIPFLRTATQDSRVIDNDEYELAIDRFLCSDKTFVRFLDKKREQFIFKMQLSTKGLVISEAIACKAAERYLSHKIKRDIRKGLYGTIQK